MLSPSSSPSERFPLLSVSPSLPVSGYGAASPSSPSSGRSLTLVKFVALGFWLVCGGPFGIEAIVIAGGPLLALCGFFLAPLLWSLPQALLTAELSSAFPSNGGYIKWISATLGNVPALFAGLNGSLGQLVDLALYPSLVAAYAAVALPGASALSLFAVKFSIVLVCLLINLRGLREVGNFSAFLTLAVLAPFALAFALEAPEIARPGNRSFMQVPESIDWGVFLSTLLWCFSGYDQLGNLAGEVKNPGRTYPIGSFMTILMVTATYALPTIWAIQTHPDISQWRCGSLADFARAVSPLLGHFTIAACILANVGLYSAGLSASSRAFSSMAQGPQPQIPRVFSYSRGHTPVAALFTLSAVVAILMVLDFTELVQADMLLACVRVLFEVAAFIQFRRSRSAEECAALPFQVPHGLVGVFYVALPNVFIAAWTCWSADKQTWAIAAAVNAVGVAAWAFGKLVRMKEKTKDEENGEGDEENFYHRKQEKLKKSRNSQGPRGLNPKAVAALQNIAENTATSLKAGDSEDSQTTSPLSASPAIRPELLELRLKVNSIIVNPYEIAQRQAAIDKQARKEEFEENQQEEKKRQEKEEKEKEEENRKIQEKEKEETTEGRISIGASSSSVVPHKKRGKGRRR